jgi:DNA-binding response OmpR family regulator
VPGILPSEPVCPRLLIVDDEPNVLVGLQRYFQTVGFQVDCASERREAEALLWLVPYDCLIADLCLTQGHGPDGLELIGLAREASPRTRIVVVTAVEGSEVEAEAVRLGADLYLRKPMLLSEVVRLVNELLAAAS